MGFFMSGGFEIMFFLMILFGNRNVYPDRDPGNFPME